VVSRPAVAQEDLRRMPHTDHVIGPEGVGDDGDATSARHRDRAPLALAPVSTGPSAHERTAEELMLAVADGDQVAFAALYDRMAPAVHGTARAVLRDPDHAAEVTQEVMLEAWRTAARYDAAQGTVRTWMVTLAHRRAVDRVRSVQSQRDRDQRALDGEHHSPFDAVAEEVEEAMERRRVRQCLGALTETQRDAVVLAYYGGQSYREVAEQLAAPLPTVKSRIRDGLIRLRDCLGVGS
jgi:RNA polymerase sigma-70 factor (ECF subfamily)